MDWFAVPPMNISNVHPLTAVGLPFVVAPFGYLLGSLFVVHVVRVVGGD